jgi:hypothetical protein
MVSLPAMFKLWKLQEGQEVIPLPRSLVAYGPLPFCGDRGRSPRIGGRRGANLWSGHVSWPAGYVRFLPSLSLVLERHWIIQSPQYGRQSDEVVAKAIRRRATQPNVSFGSGTAQQKRVVRVQDPLLAMDRNVPSDSGRAVRRPSWRRCVRDPRRSFGQRSAPRADLGRPFVRPLQSSRRSYVLSDAGKRNEGLGSFDLQRNFQGTRAVVRKPANRLMYHVDFELIAARF